MSPAPLTLRAHQMRRKHQTESMAGIRSWRMSTETAKAMLAEHETFTDVSADSTLFGSPLVTDDSMAFGVIDLVPEGFSDYPPATH